MLAFIFLIGMFAFVHRSVVLSSLCRRNQTFEGFVNEIQRRLPGEFEWQEGFVEFNGAVARGLGRDGHNKIVRLRGGQLLAQNKILLADEMAEEAKARASDLAKLAIHARRLGVPFLYVQAPIKVDEQGSVLPYGGVPNVNVLGDCVCAALNRADADVLDLRGMLASSQDKVLENFFRTDHHWTIDAAFSAFPVVVRRMMHELNRNVKAIEPYVDRKKWARHERKEWFLGSEGRRVGRYYAGLDDISWYVPEFDTEMSCAVPQYNIFRNGSFRDALVLEGKYLRERPPLFSSNPYALYIGCDYPLVKHRNPEAPVRANVLVVKDSFMLPLQAFLSTIFSDMDVIDLREYADMSLKERLEADPPDLLMVMYNPFAAMTRKMFDFGLGKRTPDTCNGVFRWQEVQAVDRFRIAASPKPFNCRPLCGSDRLRNGDFYCLDIGGVRMPLQAQGVTICLYDYKTEQCGPLDIVDLRAVQSNGSRWIFRVPTRGKWSLLLYAGVRGDTAGRAVELQGLLLKRRIR